jgi:hypothetical protein
MVAVLLRGRFALVRAAVRAADAIDRVQRREQDQDRGGQEPSHELIILWFDSVPAVEHPRAVVRLVQRLATIALAFALMAGNAAVCAGWMPTPEARMACCADGAECPMHKGDSHRSGSQRVLTQAQADSCCASSEDKTSNQSSPTFVAAITAAVLGNGMVVPASVPPLVLSDAWRTSAPLPVAPVAKHVLLSVFLV